MSSFKQYFEQHDVPKILKENFYSAIYFGIVGPLIGTSIFIILFSLYSLKLSGFLLILFPLSHVMGYIFGGIPAFITGFCLGHIKSKLAGDIQLMIAAAVIGFVVQAIYLALFARPIGGFSMGMVLSIVAAVTSTLLCWMKDHLTQYIPSYTFINELFGDTSN